MSMITETPFLDETNWLSETSLSFVFKNNFPISKGHVLICPKRVVATPFELTEEELTDIMALAKSFKLVLDETYAPDGYNMGWNIGEAAGQSVQHVHLHIIPRYQGDHPAPRGGICKGLLPSTPAYYK